jgi:peptidoglycan/LPS O-acetylase OafA/YrhL
MIAPIWNVSMAAAEQHPARAVPPYPEQIRPLAGLQFIALAWVVLNQFRFHLGLHAGDRFGVVFKGYLGAELFFVLAGFAICHLYTRRTEAGAFNYRSFLWERLIGFYPLHIVTIAVMGLLGLLASVSHVQFQPGTFDPGALVANLLLVHAWGILPTVSWNFPSWLVSAQWFGLLIFPAVAWVAMKGWSRAVLAVLTPVILFSALFIEAGVKGVLFTDMTAQVGALQVIPAFLMGAGLYRLGQERSLPRGWGAILAAAAGVWIVVAASLRLTDLVIWPAFGAVVFGLAETARTSRPALSSPAWLYLGQISYAMYLVYLPVDIVYFHGLERLVGTPSGAAAWMVWAGVFPVIMVAAVLAHHLIAQPAQVWLAKRDPFRRRAATGVASA